MKVPFLISSRQGSNDFLFVSSSANFSTDRFNINSLIRSMINIIDTKNYDAICASIPKTIIDKSPRTSLILHSTLVCYSMNSLTSSSPPLKKRRRFILSSLRMRGWNATTQAKQPNELRLPKGLRHKDY